MKENFFDGSKINSLKNFFSNKSEVFIMSICDICGQQVSNLKNHKRSHTTFCVVCDKYVSNGNLTRHKASALHQRKLVLYNIKELPYFNESLFRDFNIFIYTAETQRDGTVTIIRCQPYMILDTVDSLKDEIPKFTYKMINEKLTAFHGLKIQLILKANFSHRINEFEEIKYIPSDNEIITSKDEIKNKIHVCINRIATRIEEWDNNEAYLRLDRIIYLDVKIRIYQPFQGSSYIQTPKWIADKKATINIKNEDEYCFKYCVMYGLFKNEIKYDPERVSHYKKLEEKYHNSINFDKIKFPFEVKDYNMRMFQNKNPTISLNIYYVEDKMILPLKFCAEEKINHMNLLLIQNSSKTHFIYIKSLSRLVSSQVNDKNGKKYFCNKCFAFKYTQADLDKHKVMCDNYFKTHKALPILCKKGTILKFKNFAKTVPVPVMIYADLESIIQNEDKQHIPCSYGYRIVSTIELNDVEQFEVYTGKDCIFRFMNKLKAIAQQLDGIFKSRNKEFLTHNLTNEEEEQFQCTNICHFCCKLIEKDDVKVRDHCHLTGKYRGPAHNKCNINVREKSNVKVVFHNGSNYDFKLLVKHLYHVTKDIRAIACNEEKFIMFAVNIPQTRITYEFIDSYRFLAESLDILSKNLIRKQGFESLKYTNEYFKNESIIGKGYLCYEYLDSFDKLDERTLPQHEQFYSSVKSRNITTDEYNSALTMFKALKCRTLKDYLESYLRLDVLLLADVFEHFRGVCLQIYKLDPAHYYSVPGLTWDAANKFIYENYLTELEKDIKNKEKIFSDYFKRNFD